MYKILFIGLFFFIHHALPGQQILLTGSSDTLYSTTADTVYKMKFALRNVQLQSVQTIVLKTHSGSALQGVDYVLLDGYHAKSDSIKITNVKDKAGAFEIMVTGNLSSPKLINLQIFIYDNSKTSSDILRLYLLPQKERSVKPKEPEKKTEETDSLLIFQYQKNNINIRYNPKLQPDTTIKRRALKKLKSDGYWLNIKTCQVDSSGKDLYRFSVISTNNEVFFGEIEIKSPYEIRPDHVLYLNGNPSNVYLYTSQLFKTQFQKKGVKSAVYKELYFTKFSIK